MKRTFSVFKALTTASVKNPSALFWMIIFPILLLLILASVFSNVQKSVNVRIAIVNENITFRRTNLDFASYITTTLEKIAHKSERSPISYLESATTAKALGIFLKDLKDEKIDAVMVIPKDFDSLVYAKMAKLPLKADPIVTIYKRRNSQSSNIAFSILDSVLSSFNKRFWKMKKEHAISLKIEYLTRNGEKFSYVDFLTTGIIVMALMTVSLFGVTDDLLVQREKKVLRRLFVSPITKIDYVLGMSLSNILLELIQITLILITGIALGAHLKIDAISIAFMLFVIASTMPFGFFVASISKSANSGNAIANILNFLFMFLGGLFFPVNNVPFIVKIMAYSLPTTYLANGLRSLMGVSYSTTPLYLNIFVPLGWAAFTLFYSVKKFKWEV